MKKTFPKLLFLSLIFIVLGCGNSSDWQWWLIEKNPELNSSVSAVTYGEGSTTLFAKKYNDNQIYGYNLEIDDDWWALPTPYFNSSNVSASMWGEENFVVFTRGSSNHFNFRKYDLILNNWESNWSSMDVSSIPVRPTVLSIGYGGLALFAVGLSNDLKTRFYQPSSHWAPWKDLSIFVEAAPSGVQRGEGRISVVVHGADNKLFLRNWNAPSVPRWGNWIPIFGLDVFPSSAPAIAWKEDFLHIFAKGPDQALYHLELEVDKNGTPIHYSQWERVGGCLSQDPTAITETLDSVSVFVVTCNENLYKITKRL